MLSFKTHCGHQPDCARSTCPSPCLGTSLLFFWASAKDPGRFKYPGTLVYNSGSRPVARGDSAVGPQAKYCDPPHTDEQVP